MRSPINDEVDRKFDGLHEPLRGTLHTGQARVISGHREDQHVRVVDRADIGEVHADRFGGRYADAAEVALTQEVRARSRRALRVAHPGVGGTVTTNVVAA